MKKNRTWLKLLFSNPNDDKSVWILEQKIINATKKSKTRAIIYVYPEYTSFNNTIIKVTNKIKTNFTVITSDEFFTTEFDLVNFIKELNLSVNELSNNS